MRRDDATDGTRDPSVRHHARAVARVAVLVFALVATVAALVVLARDLIVASAPTTNTTTIASTGADRRGAVTLVLASGRAPLAPAVHPALLPAGERLTLTGPWSDVSASLLRVPEEAPAKATHSLGRRLLETDWLAERALAPLIGPHFDSATCTGCHGESRGGAGAATDEPLRIARLVQAPASDGSATHDVASPQLTRHTRPDGEPSRRLALEFVPESGRFDDGEPYELRTVVATMSEGGHRHGPETLALRVAPPLYGWGLIERIAPMVLARMADPDDRDGDGISGRLALSNGWLGRFGWKAAQPTLRRQSAAALYHDMGVTSEEFPDPACADAAAHDAPSGADCHELVASGLDALVAYLAATGVPDRRDRHALPVQRGARLFSSIGCADCHVPAITIDPEVPGSNVVGGAPRREVLWPYSDLLLHDMGDALADPAPTLTGGVAVPGDPVPKDAVASRHEWRTPPLWGIGLLAARPDQRFLHDGRARTPLEAALWHGGEGAAARDRLLALPSQDRAALVAFLDSL